MPKLLHIYSSWWNHHLLHSRSSFIVQSITMPKYIFRKCLRRFLEQWATQKLPWKLFGTRSSTNKNKGNSPFLIIFNLFNTNGYPYASMLFHLFHVFNLYMLRIKFYLMFFFHTLWLCFGLSCFMIGFKFNLIFVMVCFSYCEKSKIHWS